MKPVDVELYTYEVTYTAYDAVGKTDVYSATFKAVANAGHGGHTEQLPMYDERNRPITYTLSAIRGQENSEKWLIQAQNVAEDRGYRLFYAEDLLELTKDQSKRLVLLKGS